MVAIPVDGTFVRVCASPDGKLAALARLIDNNPDDLEDVLALEARTNELARDAASIISAIPDAHRYRGPHVAFAMMPFVLRRPSRFADGSYGVYYAADKPPTAVAEHGYHLSRMLAESKAAAQTLRRVMLNTEVQTQLQDVRRRHSDVPPEVYHPGDYAQGQILGRQLRDAGASGVIYDSVRAPGNECIGLFRPNAIAAISYGPPILYAWDKTTLTPLLTL